MMWLFKICLNKPKKWIMLQMNLFAQNVSHMTGVIVGRPTLWNVVIVGLENNFGSSEFCRIFVKQLKRNNMFFNTTKKEKRAKRSEEMKSVIDTQVKKRNEYYASLIADICLSRANISKDGTLLYKTEYYGYYEHDDTILVYWNVDIKHLLTLEGINSWNDSDNNLIVKLHHK